MEESDRSQLHFALKVRCTFSFLERDGFAAVEALPTLVRYRKGNIEADVYFGRQSYEIGAGITKCGTRYAMSEILRVSNSDLAKNYRNAVAKTSEGVAIGVEELSRLLHKYGIAALHGDPDFFLLLEERRKKWGQEYALDVLVAQLRPQANDAFQRHDYTKAAELYGHIRDRLSPTEVKKLAFAEKRSRD